MPIVSVLMPIYHTNHHHLKEAIESILTQTYKDFEFLILNDSPDDTEIEKIVLSYPDERIKYIKNEKNMGITPSRNKLMELAQGKYFMVMDHDDISLPTRMEKQVNFLENHEEVGVVGSFVKHMVANKKKEYPIENNLIEKHLMFSCPLAHPSTMLRASVLKKHHIVYEEKFSPAEDYSLYCRLIGKTKFYNMPEVLFLYRDHEGNTSHKQRKKMDKATFLIYEMVHQNKPNLWTEVVENSFFRHRFYLFGFPIISFKTKGKKIKPILSMFYQANVEDKIFSLCPFISCEIIGKKRIYKLAGIPLCWIKSKFIYR
ncbi:MAG: glycosyltransferase [Alphaproteobacteria bacterium]|nr:glycosyltransferase [Alphaproteobacteria bacterium]